PAEGHGAVAVRGAVPVAEPDDPEDHPRRDRLGRTVGRVSGQFAGAGRAAVGAGGMALQTGKTGHLRLTGGATSAGVPGACHQQKGPDKKARSDPGLLFAVTLPPAYSLGWEASVRRVVVGVPIGSNFQRLTAFSASRSKVRGGLERSTRASVTEPSVPTEISSSTSPEVPERSASAG